MRGAGVLSLMRTTLGAFFSYIAAVALLVGSVALAVILLTPADATTQPQAQATEQKLSSSPRIAAWQERIAEETVYAERAAARDAEEKAKWAALAKPRITPQVAVDDSRSRELEDRERARAQREAMRRVQLEYARQNDPFAYAPAPSRPRYNYIFSTMRDSRGGN